MTIHIEARQPYQSPRGHGLCLGARVRHRKTGAVGHITFDAIVLVGKSPDLREVLLYEVELDHAMPVPGLYQEDLLVDTMWPLTADDIEALP